MTRPAPIEAAAPPAAGAYREEQYDLSVIIVNYNVREFLEQALRSVYRAARDLEIEVFVVDNNSVDGSVEMVRTHFPDVRLITNDRNVGFGRANNQAIREASGRYLLILNPDTIVQEDTLAELVSFMEGHPEAGAVGCRILNPDGSFAPESRRAFPTPAVAFYRMTGLSRLFPRSRTFGRYNMTFLPEDEPAEVDALSGSCMLVRRAAIFATKDAFDALQKRNGKALRNGAFEGAPGAGMFDESFFMYGEDLDWCYRIQQAGWKILYTPQTQIIHYKGESTKKGELRYVKLFYGAMLQFSEKHFEARHSRFFAFLVRLGIMIRAALSLCSATLRAVARPAADFLVMLAAGALGAFAWAAVSATTFPPLFYVAVPGAYALLSTLGIAALHGYQPARYPDARATALGIVLGFVVATVLSFFMREVAFSRGVLLLSFLAMGGAMALRRSWQDRARSDSRRAVLVGPVREARRLREILRNGGKPTFEMIGYVDASAAAATPEDASDPSRLGSTRQLRDIVRLNDINEVIFASDGLHNHAIFSMILQLRDLPVHTRMLVSGRDYLIGKASIDNLCTPKMVEAEDAVGHPRSTAARRLFDLALSVVLLPLWPVSELFRTVAPGAVPGRLIAVFRRIPSVIAGRVSFVGVDPSEINAIPEDWTLPRGIVSVTHSMANRPRSQAELRKAYWFYVQNQSARLDLQILLRAVRRKD